MTLSALEEHHGIARPQKVEHLGKDGRPLGEDATGPLARSPRTPSPRLTISWQKASCFSVDRPFEAIHCIQTVLVRPYNLRAVSSTIFSFVSATSR
jgi:hypothetical protein